MAHFLAARDRAPTKSPTVKFEGGAYGTGISFFAVDTGPGQGVGLHVHPYAETWFVQEGNVAFQAGTDQVDAGPGDIMVVEAGLPHGFRNTGSGRLKMMCIHDSAEIIQTFIGEEKD